MMGGGKFDNQRKVLIVAENSKKIDHHCCVGPGVFKTCAFCSCVGEDARQPFIRKISNDTRGNCKTISEHAKKPKFVLNDRNM